MKTKVELEQQVVDFVRSLAPEPRRWLRRALQGLEDDQGDVKQLEGDLGGCARLRVHGYRVILRFFRRGSRRVVRCVYAERRSLVYEVFAEVLRTR